MILKSVFLGTQYSKTVLNTELVLPWVVAILGIHGISIERRSTTWYASPVYSLGLKRGGWFVVCGEELGVSWLVVLDMGLAIRSDWPV